MKKHILLIEQHQQCFADFMDALHSVDIECKVTFTDNVDHALQMLQYLDADCIFMRAGVNDDRSLDSIKKVRDRIAGVATKLIVYDDEVSGSLIKRSITQGADYCIDRPCNCSDFNHLFKDIFELT